MLNPGAIATHGLSTRYGRDLVAIATAGFILSRFPVQFPGGNTLARDDEDCVALVSAWLIGVMQP